MRRIFTDPAEREVARWTLLTLALLALVLACVLGIGWMEPDLRPAVKSLRGMLACTVAGIAAMLAYFGLEEG